MASHVGLTHLASDSQITPIAERQIARYFDYAIHRRQWDSKPGGSHVYYLNSFLANFLGVLRQYYNHDNKTKVINQRL